MDPFSLSTGIVGLISVALKLVVGALGMIDKTVVAYDEAADELKGVQQDLEQLQKQMIRIHGILKVLASNTKDRGFKKLLQDEYGQVAIREMCDVLEGTFSTLTQMTDRTNSDDLRPAPLPSNKKSLEFTRAILRHTFTPSTITELVKGLRDMRSDVETCLTELETTFQHVQALYDIMNNGAAHGASRASIFSTSTNLTVRIQLAAWLKGLEGTWGLSRHRRSISLRDFLRSKQEAVRISHMTDDLLAVGISHTTDDLLAVGFSHMTDDLLGEIFHHLCERGPLSLRDSLFVSKRFYTLAVNNAYLWTTISLDSHFFHHFHQWPEQGIRFVEHCLLRSGSLPLSLYIDYSDIDARTLTPLLHPLETFGKPEWGGFQRCISLILGAKREEATTIQTLVNLLPKSLPSLKHLSLTSFNDLFGGSQFPNCPMLERVEMLDHQRPSPHFWGTDFLQVTTLSFGNYDFDFWADFDLVTLSLFPMLHTLTLFTLRSVTALPRAGSRLPVIFEHLHILRAYGYIPPVVLSKLVAPALEELHLEANVDNVTSIHALQSLFEPRYQYIYVLLPQTVSVMEPEWATNLSKLVQKCTRIRSLHISRWMEEECKKFISGQDVVLRVQ